MSAPNKCNGELNGSCYLAPRIENIPSELAALGQWLLWVAMPRADGGKSIKLPVNPSGYLASTTNPNTWSTFAAVKAAYEAAVARGYINCKIDGKWQALPVAGIGFVFDGTCDADGNTYVGIDFDHVLEHLTERLNR
jgi:primase-polymerase (primpol)-like protein